MDVHGSARRVVMVLPTLSDAGKAACVLPLARFIAVRGLVFLGVARAWFSWDWAVLATLFDAGRAAYVVPWLGYRWVLAWFSSWYWWVLLGVLVGIAGYCGGYWWVLVPSFDVFASFSLGFL